MVSLSKQGPVRYGDGSPPPRFDDSIRFEWASPTKTAKGLGQSHPQQMPVVPTPCRERAGRSEWPINFPNSFLGVVYIGCVSRWGALLRASLALGLPYLLPASALSLVWWFVELTHVVCGFRVAWARFEVWDAAMHHSEGLQKREPPLTWKEGKTGRSALYPKKGLTHYFLDIFGLGMSHFGGKSASDSG